MTRVISIEDLKGLFTKPYGTDAPTKQKWAEFYNENVIFTDPTQETEGLDLSLIHISEPTRPR